MNWQLMIVGVLGLAGGGCQSSALATQNEGPALEFESSQANGKLFLDGFFPVGVFSQPVESFGKWKQRGINTILEVPQNHDPATWDRAAQAAGLRIIRRPLGDGRGDIGRKDLLAWSHWDEPDAAGRIKEWTPMFEKTYAEWRRIDPNRKIFVNFAGPDLSWFTTRSDAYSRDYASYYPRLLATADWIANDLYPSGGWLNNAHQPRRGDVTLIAEPMKILKRMTDKPLFAFIEASEIEKGNVPGARCPTPAEMRAQIWIALIHGARGLFYFPAVVGTSGFRFDGAPQEIVDEMTRQNALLSRLAPMLQGEINPASQSCSATSGVEIGWRADAKSILMIVVNPQRNSLRGVEIAVPAADGEAGLIGSTQKVRIQGGRIRDDFEPLGVNLYLISR